MKIPLSWLKEFINLEQSPAQIAAALTRAGLEVDAIESTTPAFSQVVVGHVVEVAKHPDADKLVVAKVFDGRETHQVVCGAPNCRAGIKTAFAMIGASLPSDDGKSFKVKKTKLRGVESSGMLCSSKELLLGDDHDGIMELDASLQVGTDIAALYADTVFEISLTPNLGHCSSALGVSRELSAASGLPVLRPQITFAEEASSPVSLLAKVQIQDFEKCPRYSCRVIKEVKVGPSPEWLQNRLKRCDVRPINNVVDITNYVMLEMGHPLHAFDLDRLDGSQIIVRCAKDGETIQTLDEKERSLTSDDLLICDKNKPVAIAGVMGGMNSEVSEGTTNILLESAYFLPTSIRKSSKRLGLMTDASKRFERGTDPNNVVRALDRAAMLLHLIAGGKVASGVIDVKEAAFPEKVILCRLSRINNLLGTRLGVSEVEEIFKRLEMTSKWDGQDIFSVTVPTYRTDIQAEIDLVEEAARIYGFENIPNAKPKYHASTLPHAPIYLFENEIRARLMSEGLQELLTCDLIGPSGLEVIGGSLLPEECLVRVVNPTSIEQSILRTSLLPGLLQVVKYNFDHQNHDINGFEIGRVHFKEGEKYKEHSVAGIILSGKCRPHSWDLKAHDYDFYDLKGIVENLLNELGISNYKFKENDLHTFHDGRQAAIYVGDLEIGSMGEIHPAIQRRLDVPQRIMFAELNLHDLYPLRKGERKMQEISKYPCSERDWTVTLKEEAAIEQVISIFRSFKSTLLEDVQLIDIYRSEKLGKGLKNTTFHFVYRDKEKTVSQEEVEAEHARIVSQSLKAMQDLRLA